MVPKTLLTRAAALFLCLSVSVPVFSDDDWGTMDAGLYWAVYRKKIEEARSLLEAGAKLDGRKDNGRTVAYYAGGAEMLELLASYGARFDVVDIKGKSPLMVYLDDGKSVEANFVFDWEQRRSPRFSASFNSRKEYLTNQLLWFQSSGGGREARKALLKGLLDAGADPAVRNSSGIPIVLNVSREYIPLFIEAGAPIEGFDDSDRNLLMKVADYTYSKDSSELVEYLLAHGADPNERNSKGDTALMYTMNEAVAAALLAYGADPHLQNNEGKTALMRTWYTPEVQRLLLRVGANAAVKDNKGRTAMHNWHIKAGMALLDELLAAGCPLDDPDINGITPLMNVVDSSDEDDIDAILALLEKGADPNKSRDREGKSVLHVYVERARSIGKEAEPVVAALLAAGARPTDADKNGDSALSFSLSYSRLYPDMKPLSKMLLKYTSAAETKTAKARAAKIRGDNIRDALSDDGSQLATVITIFFLVTGLSIVMREKVFAGNPSKNLIGPLNGLLTMCAAGVFFGFVIGGNTYKGSSSGAWADMFGPVLQGGFGAIVGFICGSIIACLPPVRKAFTKYRALYYIPSVISAVVMVLVIREVFRWV